MMGAGKPKISLYKPSRNVFLRTGQKSGVLKNMLKYLKPTQSLSVIPLNKL
jgi:hypothetical protein